MQVREKPFNWVHTHSETQALRLEVDFCKHYRHALMYPGQPWAVYAPTDSFEPYAGTVELWNFVEMPEKPTTAESMWNGSGWYCKRAVEDMGLELSLQRRSPIEVPYSIDRPCGATVKVPCCISRPCGAPVKVPCSIYRL